MTHTLTLRERLIARNTGQIDVPEPFPVAATGRIDADTVTRIHNLACDAKGGNLVARDQLWRSLQPRLDRVSWALKPWPNSATLTGIWERNDVRQESWIVFAELLVVWDGAVPFIPYLLARFQWRLRDRILRGIGKRQTQFGEIRVPEGMLADLLVASDGEQPESVILARRLLEELLQRRMTGEGSPGELEAWLDLINSPTTTSLVSPDYLLAEPPPENQRRVG